MAFEFKLQDPGEGIHEAEIVELLVSEGDTVSEGDDVLVAETDKAAVEIPSPVSGEIAEIRVAEGDTVEVGDVLMTIETGDDAEDATDDSGEDNEAAEAEDAGEEEAEEEEADEGEEMQSGESDEGARDRDRDEEDESEDLATGADEAKDKETAEAARRASGSGKEGRGGEGDAGERPAKATPAVRKLARELDVDLKSVEGSGEEGRVLKDDVRAAAGETGEKAEGARERKAERPKDAGGSAEERREPLRSIRRATARRMAQAWSEIPHVTHHERIDITALERVRREHAGSVEAEGGKLTLTPFLMKALGAALRQHPRFNARLDADAEEIVYLEAINMGVAIDTPRGLIVPVIRDADRKSVLDLALELGELAAELRQKRPARETLSGGTFTLTNVGALGGSGFTPIINPPQVGIFGAARARLEPLIEGDIEHAETRAALILPVCLGFDHRVNDGADGARFMNSVRQMLEEPAELLIRN